MNFVKSSSESQTKPNIKITLLCISHAFSLFMIHSKLFLQILFPHWSGLVAMLNLKQNSGVKMENKMKVITIKATCVKLLGSNINVSTRLRKELKARPILVPAAITGTRRNKVTGERSAACNNVPCPGISTWRDAASDCHTGKEASKQTADWQQLQAKPSSNIACHSHANVASSREREDNSQNKPADSPP